MSQRVFQHYFARVSAAFQNCPDQLATELFSEKLISKQTTTEILTTEGLSSARKSHILVCCVQNMIASESSDKPLKKLCKVMKAHQELESLARKMTDRFGKCTLLKIANMKAF